MSFSFGCNGHYLPDIVLHATLLLMNALNFTTNFVSEKMYSQAFMFTLVFVAPVSMMMMIISNLSYDRSTASSKMIPPLNAI
jgi:hypothetical protein